MAIPDRRPDAVVVIGGDGTLRAAVQRLITLYDVDAPPLLPVPLGTANLIGQYLGLQRSVAEIALEGARHLVESSGVLRGLGAPESEIARQQALRAVQALDQMRIARIDAGLANDQLFLVMAGVGFDAHVVHELARRRSGPIGLSSYALPAAAAVTRYSFAPLRVEVDGGRAFGWRPGVVMIANLPQYGTGFPIVPGARPDDGLLDVLCLPCDSRMRLLELLVLAADQRHLSVEGAVQVRGREVFVEAQTSVPVQIDGDPGGTLPLRVRLSPQRVSLIRP